MSFGNRSEGPFPWRHSKAALSRYTVACIKWKTSARRTCCKHFKGFMTLNDFSRIYAPPFLEILKKKKEIGSVTLLTASSCVLDDFNGGQLFISILHPSADGKMIRQELCNKTTPMGLNVDLGSENLSLWALRQFSKIKKRLCGHPPPHHLCLIWKLSENAGIISFLCVA